MSTIEKLFYSAWTVFLICFFFNLKKLHIYQLSINVINILNPSRRSGHVISGYLTLSLKKT